MGIMSSHTKDKPARRNTQDICSCWRLTFAEHVPVEDSGLFPELAQGGRGWEDKDRSFPNARDLRSECPKLRSRTGNRPFPFSPAASVSRPLSHSTRRATIPKPAIVISLSGQEW